MTSDLQLGYLSAGELSTAFRERSLSPVEVHDAIAAVIAAREPHVNAFAVHDPEVSREQAVSSAQRWASGQQRSDLDGVPITLKENIAQAGVPMSAGTAGLEPTVPDWDAPITQRAHSAGLVVLGSTVMPDWGMLSSGLSSRHGVTRSPLDLSLTTGGSSSGAGAAAAGGYGPLHVGSDIGGSVRLPATWMGLVALKPSFGRIPLDRPYLGRVAGPITRNVPDTAALMSVLSGFDPRDTMALPTMDADWEDLEWSPRGARIGLLLETGCGPAVDPEVAAAVTACAQTMAEAGAQIVPMSPFMTPDLLAALDLFWRVRSWNDYRDLDQDARARVLPFVAAWCTAGSDVSGRDVLESYHQIMRIQQATLVATEEYDFVLSPVTQVAAFSATDPMPFAQGVVQESHAMDHIGFTAPVSMSGQPALSVHCGHMADGRTIGVQISGRRFDDLGVLRAATWYERNRDAKICPSFPTGELIPTSWAA